MHLIDEDDFELPLKTQAERTVEAIEQYRQVKFSIADSIEQADDLVFYLLEKGKYDENLDQYQATVVLLLKLFSMPEMATICRRCLRDEERVDIARLLYNMYDFFRQLNSEQYRSLFDLKFVKYHYANDDLGRLMRMEQQYKALVRAYFVEKGDNNIA